MIRRSYHMILQYTKGDTFRIGQKTCTVPLSNRLIMDYDTIHKDLRIDPGFQRYLEEHAEQILSYNISGLNAILDVELLKKRLQEADRHYRTLKERNPGCIFYFESAHYLSPQVKHEVYHTMARYVDILGMNEEELAVHTQECGESMDKHSSSGHSPGPGACAEPPQSKRHPSFTPKTIPCYYGKELKGVKIEKGLTIGNLMASTRARTGRYGTLEDCRETLACPLSETGLRFARELDSTSMSIASAWFPPAIWKSPSIPSAWAIPLWRAYSALSFPDRRADGDISTFSMKIYVGQEENIHFLPARFSFSILKGLPD